jgi:2-oxoglutarate ferredoxin oxidoreductase subunit beta
MAEKKYTKPASIIHPAGYCGGCGHGIIQRLIAESLEELDMADNVINVCDIACAYWSLDALDFEAIAGPHGRCAAVATGIKKVRPDATVYVHAGDGCSYVIGLAETCFAADRDIPLTMIVVNNGVFGMTGGQLCLATTLVGDKTVSSVKGRNAATAGKPFDALGVLKNFDIQFAARGALYDPKHIDETKKYLKKGFENQRDKKGFSIIEILSPCPTNWRLSPVAANEKIKTQTETVFPLGVYVDRKEAQNG